MVNIRVFRRTPRSIGGSLPFLAGRGRGLGCPVLALPLRDEADEMRHFIWENGAGIIREEVGLCTIRELLHPHACMLD